jgi:signal transduction histidine kinase
MRERARMIEGTLDIQSARDYGTAVILEVSNPEEPKPKK